MATRETGGDPAAKDVKDVAATAMDDVRNTTDRILDRGRDEARGLLEGQQRRASEGLTGVADALHSAADRMEERDIGFIARYADTAADQVETWARQVQQRDINDVLADAENYARRNPEIFVGGAFLAGFLVARVAKASSDRRRMRERNRHDEMGGVGQRGGASDQVRGYGYAGNYPGGIVGDAGPRGATATAGSAGTTGAGVMRTPGAGGTAPLSAAGGPSGPTGTPLSAAGGTPKPGSPSATETGGTGNPFAAAGSRAVGPGPGSQGSVREAAPAKPGDAVRPVGKDEK